MIRSRRSGRDKSRRKIQRHNKVRREKDRRERQRYKEKER
jgi:hypothetical protein